jgi:hypothetical protein
MSREFNWLVFERGSIVAGFVYRHDAVGFVEQCGGHSMKTFAASAKGVMMQRKRVACRRKHLRLPKAVKRVSATGWSETGSS